MPLNIGPNPGFMQRMLGATNAVGQSMGGPMGQASRLTAGMNQNRIGRQPMPRTGMPSATPGVMSNPSPSMGGMPSLPPLSDPMSGTPNMPFVQGPSQMPNFQLGRDTGGNMGINGGMMGGFQRPQIQTGNVMNDNTMNPNGSSLWSKYQNMQRPQMSAMFQ